MSLKTKIKNDMWRWNYILPFVKKHQFDEKGKVDMLKHVLKAYSHIHLVKSKQHTVGSDTLELLNKVNIIFDESSRFVYFIDTAKTIAVPGNILSNFTLDYNRIIHSSFASISNSAIGMDKYGKEAKYVVDAVFKLRDRIKNAISNSVLPVEVRDKQTIYFNRLLDKPAEHFEEALQRILFFNQILWQTRHRLNGLGRLDKILVDLYEKDKADGIINKELACEIVYDFLNQLSKYSNYKSDALEGDIGQVIILGGNEPDGTYFSNELTLIFLQQQAKLGKPDPKTLLRVGKFVPINLMNLAVECLLSRTGSPLFSNDEVVIPALLDFGMSKEDAYSYCTSACWEPFIVGKSMDQNNISVFDFHKALDEVLDRECTSFDELIKNYKSVNERYFIEFLEQIDQMKWAKDPLVSLFTDGCNENRVDISEGGAFYNNYGITTVAISNVVDSLLNIRKFVFEQQRYSLQKFNEFRKDNFKNNDDLYRELQMGQKYYGHDLREVVALVNDLSSSLSIVAQNYKNKLGGTVKFGLSSPGYNILSKKASADYSGRKYGMPYNTHISCIDASYTELVGFASKLESGGQRFNGNVIDYFVSPSFIQDNKEKFVLFMKGAIYSGFFQMQMNIMDSKTLIDAKTNPDRYKGLVVRVWGFSAYFNELPESYQNLLIERAMAAEKIG